MFPVEIGARLLTGRERCLVSPVEHGHSFAVPAVERSPKVALFE